MRAVFQRDDGLYLNLRQGPGAEYEVVDQLAPGDSINIVEKSGEWLKTEDGLYLMRKHVKLESDSLNKMTLPQLKRLAKDSGIKLENGLKKADIIERILGD